ncbi:MAG: hypothetical protein Q8M70_01695 [bacterium]|nr:hypothetical protein [bacterium]
MIVRKMFVVVVMLLLSLSIVSCQTTISTTTTSSTSTNSSNTSVPSTQTNTSTITTTQETTVTTLTPSTTNQRTIIDRFEYLPGQGMVGELFEIAFYEPVDSLVIQTLYNPYDYSQISLRVQLKNPIDEAQTIYAFWFRPYQDLRIVGGSINQDGYYVGGQETLRWLVDSFHHYRVRYTPKVAGSYQFTLEVLLDGEIIQTKAGSFEVLEAIEEVKGKVSVDTVNNKNFIFENGTTYMPMGLNLAWWSTTLASHDYANWFKKLNENNGNYARIWMANWSFSLHKDSYSNFETRQNIAIRLDHVFQRAKEYDVYIMLTLLNHGQFSAVTNPEWSENVYNKAKGGMLDFPIQFFYNAEAKKWYKNELLYIISRYGYSDHLFAWELFNEVDWIDSYSAIAVTQWHSEMATFIKQHDPFKHMVSTSYKYTFGTAAYTLPSMDFGAVHSYGFSDVHFYQKLIDETRTLWNRYQKPMFFGEIGINWQSGSTSYHTDYTGVTIRQAAWGGMMSGAGSAHHWWWDSWIEAFNMWDRFQGAGAYAKYLDLGNKTHSYLHENNQITSSHTNAKIMGYHTQDAIYGYVYHHQWNYWNKTPEPILDATIVIPLTNGLYQLTVFDTFTGVITSIHTINITSSNFSLTIPSLQEDYAFILKRI